MNIIFIIIIIIFVILYFNSDSKNITKENFNQENVVCNCNESKKLNNKENFAINFFSSFFRSIPKKKSISKKNNCYDLFPNEINNKCYKTKKPSSDYMFPKNSKCHELWEEKMEKVKEQVKKDEDNEFKGLIKEWKDLKEFNFAEKTYFVGKSNDFEGCDIENYVNKFLCKNYDNNCPFKKEGFWFFENYTYKKPKNNELKKKYQNLKIGMLTQKIAINKAMSQTVNFAKRLQIYTVKKELAELRKNLVTLEDVGKTITDPDTYIEGGRFLIEEGNKIIQDGGKLIMNGGEAALKCVTSNVKCEKCAHCTLAAGLAFKVAYIAIIEKKAVKDVIKSLLTSVATNIIINILDKGISKISPEQIKDLKKSAETEINKLVNNLFSYGIEKNLQKLEETTGIKTPDTSDLKEFVTKAINIGIECFLKSLGITKAKDKIQNKYSEKNNKNKTKVDQMITDGIHTFIKCIGVEIIREVMKDITKCNGSCDVGKDIASQIFGD